jgi:hypothetical protein
MKSTKQHKVLVVPVSKPRNPMGNIKMTGAGSHNKSNKALRSKSKQNMKKGIFDMPFFISNPS